MKPFHSLFQICQLDYSLFWSCFVSLCLLTITDGSYGQSDLYQHPLEWTPVTVHTSYPDDRVEVIGMPASFFRVGATSWKAYLPRHAWLRVGIRRPDVIQTFSIHAIEYQSEPELYLSADQHCLYLSKKLGGRKQIVGVNLDGYGTPDSILHRWEQILGKTRTVDSINISQLPHYPGSYFSFETTQSQISVCSWQH